jgi:eukaryotic-like serine/threonine-protein kinase
VDVRDRSARRSGAAPAYAADIATGAHFLLDSQTVLNDRYEVRSVLARGGMADVYLATDLMSGERIAVKMLRAASDYERFRIEADVLRRIDHPGIVGMLDVGDHDGFAYIAMEYVDGPSLRDLLLGEDGFDHVRVGEIGRDVAAGLAHAHVRGIVHRDVKPANVLVDTSGRARLADFGIARVADVAGLTATGMTMGTAAYLAPEQVSGGDVDPPADVYSLGLVLLEAFTRSPAFSGTTAESVLARLKRDPAIPPNLPDAWPALLRAMTDREPLARPSADRVAAALASGVPDLAALRDTTVTAEFPLPLVGTDPELSRGWLARSSVALGVGVAGIAAVVAFAGLGPEQVTPDDVLADEGQELAEDEAKEETDDLRDDDVDEPEADADDAGAEGGSEVKSESAQRVSNGNGGHPHGGPPGQQGDRPGRGKGR